MADDITADKLALSGQNCCKSFQMFPREQAMSLSQHVLSVCLPEAAAHKLSSNVCSDCLSRGLLQHVSHFRYEVADKWDLLCGGPYGHV